jgi:hypothetical protein
VPRRLLLIVAIVLVAVGVVAIGAATRPSEDRVALAIQKATRPNGTVLFHVECADDIEVEQRTDPEGSGLIQVTVWGRPRVGTCEPWDPGGAADNDLAVDQFVDGATSQVVTVEDSCLPEPETC